MNQQARAFLEQHTAAAMITTRPGGASHAVRVGIAVVDGKIWSSGTESRKRTAHLRRDPRATLFVFDNEWRWLTLECAVRILDGPDAPDLNIRMFQQMQAGMNNPSGTLNWFGRQYPLDELRQVLVEEGRLIYEFEVLRSYGMYGQMPGASA